MATDRMTRIEQENAETLHFLGTPVRIIMGWLKGTLLITGLIFVFLINQVGWIAKVGARGEHQRMHKIWFIGDHLQKYNGEFDDHGETWYTFDVDFRTQPTAAAEYLRNTNKFWTDRTYDYVISTIRDIPNDQVKAFKTVQVAGGFPDHGIPYCVTTGGIFDTTLGPWSTRADIALDRKSARMRIDYEVAAQMTAALRSTLVHMKLNRPMSEVYGPNLTQRGQTLSGSYCNADGAAHDAKYGKDGTRAYRAASAAVVLTHAPVVRIKYLHFSEDNGYHDPRHSEAGMEISGICLPQTCEDGLMWGTTYKDDLFAKEPPLTGDQMTAEKAMRVMASSAFWAEAARENGITDLSTVETMRKKALVDLELTLGNANYEI